VWARILYRRTFIKRAYKLANAKKFVAGSRSVDLRECPTAEELYESIESSIPSLTLQVD
jgi:hypothetical protein